VPDRVDFYLLDAADRDSLLKCACRIAGKAYQQGMRVYIQLDDDAAIGSLDQLLWTFSPTSFVPHAVAGGAEQAPVLIGDGPAPDGYEQLLVSLTREVPGDIDRYQRVADLISSDHQEKQLGRERFKHYRAKGIEPNTHQINN